MTHPFRILEGIGSSPLAFKSASVLVFMIFCYMLYHCGFTITSGFERPSLTSEDDGHFLFDKRHNYTKSYLPKSGSKFRFVSYNILSDGFARSEIASKMYNYCSEYALSKKYRRPLILKELIGYHADFLSLQECDEDMFRDFLTPKLEKKGYGGLFMKKHKGNPEGEAIFYRKERYEPIQNLSIAVKDAIYHSSNKELLSQLPKEVVKVILDRKALGLIHIFRNIMNKSKKGICILNTHLYYKSPMAHIRLVQMSILLNYLRASTTDHDKFDYIVNGDLNSPIDEPLLNYLSGLKIKKTDVVSNKIGSTELKSPLFLHSLSGKPAYTCYSPNKAKTCDYVFGSRDLRTIFFVPLPSVEDIKPYTGLLSNAYPSDHIAIVLDVEQGQHEVIEI